MTRKTLVIFAGGGTGGHVYPGIAVAKALISEFDASIRWIGTEDRMESRAVPKAGFEIDFLKVSFLKGRKGFALVKAFFLLPFAILRALQLLWKFRPRCVIGLGGFVSGPVCIAATLLRIPVFLMEQNARPGITNRLVSKVARHIFGSFEASKQYFPEKKLSILGNPVRDEILALRDKKSTLSSEKQERNILIFGGSQGASTLNNFSATLCSQILDHGIQISIKHGAGRGRAFEAKKTYEEKNLSAEVMDYIEDMAAAYQWADLIICRAGATTIAELTVVGLPAVYVPFPGASDDHQTVNAKALEEKNAGIFISDADFQADPNAFKKIVSILQSQSKLQKMAEASRAFGRPDATFSISKSIWDQTS